MKSNARFDSLIELHIMPEDCQKIGGINKTIRFLHNIDCVIFKQILFERKDDTPPFSFLLLDIDKKF